MQNNLVTILLISFNVILALLCVILLIGVIYFRQKSQSVRPKIEKITSEKVKETAKVTESGKKSLDDKVKSSRPQFDLSLPSLLDKKKPVVQVTETKCGICGSVVTEPKSHVCPIE